MAPSGEGRKVKLALELEQEEDGRWIADVTNVPGALAYGNTLEEAVAAAARVALRTLAEADDAGEQ